MSRNFRKSALFFLFISSTLFFVPHQAKTNIIGAWQPVEAYELVDGNELLEDLLYWAQNYNLPVKYLESLRGKVSFRVKSAAKMGNIEATYKRGVITFNLSNSLLRYSYQQTSVNLLSVTTVVKYYSYSESLVSGDLIPLLYHELFHAYVDLAEKDHPFWNHFDSTATNIIPNRSANNVSLSSLRKKRIVLEEALANKIQEQVAALLSIYRFDVRYPGIGYDLSIYGKSGYAFDSTQLTYADVGVFNASIVYQTIHFNQRSLAFLNDLMEGKILNYYSISIRNFIQQFNN